MVRQAVTSDIPKLAQIHVQTWIETYTGLIPEDVLQNIITLESRELQWQRTLANPRIKVLVAVIDNILVGFCSLTVQGQEAEIYTLYLLRAHQKKKLGQQLWNAALEYAKTRNAKNLVLWVLEGNPTRGFYEHMGGNLEDQRIETIGKAALPEVMYEFWL
jgi:GNAT superfamily N-acetyltransferase